MNHSRNGMTKNIRKAPVNHRILRRAALGTIVFCTAVLAGLLAYAAAREIAFTGLQVFEPAGPMFRDGQNFPAGGSLDGSSAPPLDLSTIPANPNAPVSEAEFARWDGAGRVTILLLGLDYRDWEAGTEASRSDTMILLTLDPLTKTAGILSIPRDMWAPIPGFRHGKINTAHYLGDAYNMPGGGPGLAVKTVEQFVGVPVHYYAQIDFSAFVQFIDEIGGVKIDVPEKIKIDLLGDNNTKTLKPGVQTLPGEWALAYARNRKTDGGDFDRAQRQQQVILGIRNRVLNLNMLPTLIAKAPTLYQQLKSGIHTNLALDEAIQLALLAQEIPEENIKRGVFDEKYVQFARSPDGLSILLPMPDKIHILRDEIFATSGSLAPLTSGSDQERMQAEQPRIAVFDGTRIPNMAQRSADFLRAQGAAGVEGQEPGEFYTASKIVDYTGNPYTVKYLVDLYQVSPRRIYLDYQPTSPVDVEIYLGYDAEGAPIP